MPPPVVNDEDKKPVEKGKATMRREQTGRFSAPQDHGGNFRGNKNQEPDARNEKPLSPEQQAAAKQHEKLKARNGGAMQTNPGFHPQRSSQPFVFESDYPEGEQQQKNSPNKKIQKKHNRQATMKPEAAFQMMTSGASPSNYMDLSDTPHTGDGYMQVPVAAETVFDFGFDEEAAMSAQNNGYLDIGAEGSSTDDADDHLLPLPKKLGAPGAKSPDLVASPTNNTPVVISRATSAGDDATDTDSARSEALYDLGRGDEHQQTSSETDESGSGHGVLYDVASEAPAPQASAPAKRASSKSKTNTKKPSAKKAAPVTAHFDSDAQEGFYNNSDDAPEAELTAGQYEAAYAVGDSKDGDGQNNYDLASSGDNNSASTKLKRAQKSAQDDEYLAPEVTLTSQVWITTADTTLRELERVFIGFNQLIDKQFCRELPEQLEQVNYSDLLEKRKSALLDKLTKDLYGQKALKPLINQMVLAGRIEQGQLIDSLKSFSDEKGTMWAWSFLQTLNQRTAFFNTALESEQEVAKWRDVARDFLWQRIQVLYQSKQSQQSEEALTQKTLRDLELLLTEYEVAAGHQAASAPIENKILNVLVGESGYQGLKARIDGWIKAGDAKVKQHVITADALKAYPKASACLGVMTDDFFTTPMEHLLAEGDEVDDDQYTQTMNQTPREWAAEHLQKYLDQMKEQAALKQQMILAANALNKIISAQQGDQDLESGPASDESADLHLKSLKQAISPLLLQQVTMQSLSLMITRDRESLVPLMNDPEFNAALFGEKKNEQDVINAFNDYLAQQQKNIKALESRHHVLMRRLCYGGTTMGVVIAVAGIAAVIVNYAGVYCLWSCDNTADNNNPGGPSISAVTSAVSLTQHFAAACGANVTDFSLNVVNVTAPVVVAVVGQVVRLQLTGLVNTALTSGAQLAYRFVKSAAQQLGYLSQSLSNLVFYHSDNIADTVNNATLASNQVGYDNGALIEKITINERNTTDATVCERAQFPVQIHALSDFVSLSVDQTSLTALSNNQAVPLNFHVSPSVLPDGILLRYHVTGVGNGILQRADGSFVFQTDGQFVVSAAEIPGLRFLANNGFQGQVSPTLQAQAIDTNNQNQVINLPNAQVSQTVDIEYVAPLINPTIDTSVTAGTEGGAVNATITVFADNGSDVQTRIVNIPQGVVLSKNGHSYSATDANAANNSVDISNWGSGDLSIALDNINANGAYTMTVEATSTRASTSETTTSTRAITANFAAEADIFTIDGAPSSVNIQEGADVVLTFNATATGGPGDALTGVSIRDLPVGTVVTDAPFGTSGVTQSFTATSTNRNANVLSWAADWENSGTVYLHYPAFYHTNHTLQIQTTAQEGTSTRTYQSPVTVNITPVSNPIALDVVRANVTRSQEDTSLFNPGFTFNAATVDPSENVTATVRLDPPDFTGNLVLMPSNTTIALVNGTATLNNLSQLAQLRLANTHGYVGEVAIYVDVLSQFANQTPAHTQMSSTITYQSAAPIITVNDATVNEDATVAIPVTIAQTSDLEVTNIPVGATITDGTQTFTASAGNTTLDFNLSGATPWDISQLRLTPPLHNSNNFILNFVGTNNLGQSTTETALITVTPVANVPTVTMPANIAAVEDAASIPLNIQVALVDTDGSEIIDQVLVSGVQHGHLSAGAETSTPGVWDVPVASVSTLAFIPDPNFSTTGTTPISLTVTAIAKETANNAQASQTASTQITITPVADIPNLVVTNPAAGSEDTTFNIGAGINATLTATNEVLTFKIHNVPAGASLNMGTQVNGVWEITSAANVANIANLQLTPPVNFSGVINLEVEAVSTDGPDEASVSRQMTVTVNAVADAPTAAASSVTGNEDTGIPLVISGALIDADGSESLTYIIGGVANGSLSVGTNQGGGVWHLTPAQAAVAQFVPNANWNGVGNLTLKTRATESSNNSTADSATQSFTVTVNPVTDGASISGPSTISGDENSAGVNLGLSVVKPATEQLELRVTGLSSAIGNIVQGSTVVSNSGSTWTILPMGTYTQAQINSALSNLKFRPTGEWSGSQAFTFQVRTQDAGSNIVTVSHAMVADIAGVADEPVMNALSAISGTAGTDLNLSSRLIATFANDAQETQTYRIRVPSTGYSISGTGVVDLGSRWYEIPKDNASTARLASPNLASATSISLTIRAFVSEPDGSGGTSTAFTDRTLTVNLAATPVATTTTAPCPGGRCRRGVGAELTTAQPSIGSSSSWYEWGKGLLFGRATNDAESQPHAPQATVGGPG